jgi:hypothetical protein
MSAKMASGGGMLNSLMGLLPGGLGNVGKKGVGAIGGKLGGFLGKAGKGMGGLKGGLLGAGLGIAGEFAGDALIESGNKKTGGFVKGGSEWAGTGALVGSFFGPLGTLIGGGLGFIGGGIAGLLSSSEEIAENTENLTEETKKKNEDRMKFVTGSFANDAFDMARQAVKVPAGANSFANQEAQAKAMQNLFSSTNNIKVNVDSGIFSKGKKLGVSGY